MLLLGCHVNFTQEQLYGSVKQMLSYQANALMFYTGAPQNTLRKPISDDYTLKAMELLKEYEIDLNCLICHAPYIINLANKDNIHNYQFGIEFLQNEIERCQSLGVKYLVLHPGSALKCDRKIALQNISEALNYIYFGESNVIVLLETMAGKGSECGINTSELKTILDSLENKEHFGVCLDTCHLNDSGIDISNFDQYLMNFDREIGINKIGCIHINDSKNELSSHKDRHENIGFGTIGFNNLINVIYNDKLKDIPKILETPYLGDTADAKERLYPPYKFEIEMIKNKTFDPELKDKIIEYYKNI